MPAPSPEKLPLIPKVKPAWFWPLVILLCMSFTGFAATLCITMQVRRHSAPVLAAIAEAKKDVRVQALGEPLSAGFLVSAVDDLTAGVERRDMNFFLKGPQGEGTAQMRAARPAAGGAWQIEYLRVFLPSGGDWVVLVGDQEKQPEDFKTLTTRRELPSVQQAFGRAQKDVRVGALGAPLEVGFLVESAAETKDGIERCDVRFPIHGARGQAEVRACGTRKADSIAWEFQYLEVTLPGGERVALIGDPDHPPEKWDPSAKEAKNPGEKPGVHAAPAR